MSNPKIAYFAHPVGDGVARTLNIRNAKLWIRTLVDLCPQIAICAPWLPYVEVLSEDHRERGLRDDLTILDVCHFLIAVGGRWSPGMLVESERNKVVHGRPEVDLTNFPADPRSLTGIQRAMIADAVARCVDGLA